MKKVTVSGILFFVTISPLFRGLYFSLETYAFLAALALLSVIYFMAKLWHRKPLRLDKAYVLLGLCLIVSVAAAFAKAANPRKNLEILLLYAELLVLFIVLYDYFCGNVRNLMRALIPSALAAGFVCAVCGLMALTGKFNFLEVTNFAGRVGSTFQYANTASIYFAICAIFAITLFNTSGNIFIKSLSIAVGNLVIFAFLMTGSRGGYIIGFVFILLALAFQPAGRKLFGILAFLLMVLPVFIAMKGFIAACSAHDNAQATKWLAISFSIAAASGLMFSLLYKAVARNRNGVRKKGYKAVYIALGVVAAIAVVTVFLIPEGFLRLLPPVLAARFERFIKFGFYDDGIAFRLNYDKDALKLIAENWFFGLGGGGWKSMYQKVQDFFYTAAFVHNQYLQVFVESGVIGFLSYVALVLYSCGSAVYYLKSASYATRSYAAALLCSFLALAVHASFDFDLSFVSMMLLFWVMFAAAAVGKRTAVYRTGIVNNNAAVLKNDNLLEREKAEAVAEGSIGGQKVMRVGETAVNHDVRPETDSRHVTSDDSEQRETAVPISSDKFEVITDSKACKVFMVLTCSILLSTNGLFFTASMNRQIGLNYMHKREYRTAIEYFEEAHRFDPCNPDYTFELAKLYLFQARKSLNAEKKRTWLEKARQAGEKSVKGEKYYPAYTNTLTRIYLESGMPLEALKQAQKLVLYQKYNAENYELLAKCFLAAAEYYENTDDTRSACEMLERCLEIDRNPYLRRSGIKRPADINSDKIIASYHHSEELARLLEEAKKKLGSLK